MSKIVQIRNSDKDETDLYIYGIISSNDIEDGISSKDVRGQLSKITSNTINVHINSPGGDIFESISIYNLLKNHKAKIKVYVDGLAASGAVIIALAADKVLMPRNTMMLIEKASTVAFGNKNQMRKMANQLAKADISIKQSYLTRFKGSSFKLEQMLSKGTFLTAKECLDLGLADEVLKDIRIKDNSKRHFTNHSTVQNEILEFYIMNYVSKAQKAELEPEKMIMLSNVIVSL